MQMRMLTQQATLDEAARIHDQQMVRYPTLEEKLRARIARRCLCADIRSSDDWHYGSPRCEAARRDALSRALRPGQASATR